MTVSDVPFKAGFGAAGLATTCEAGADCAAGEAADATGEPAVAAAGDAAGAAAAGLLSAGFAASAGLVSAGFDSAGGATGWMAGTPPSRSRHRPARQARESDGA